VTSGKSVGQRADVAQNHGGDLFGRAMPRNLKQRACVGDHLKEWFWVHRSGEDQVHRTRTTGGVDMRHRHSEGAMRMGLRVNARIHENDQRINTADVP
jgi:hypothetical protein